MFSEKGRFRKGPVPWVQILTLSPSTCVTLGKFLPCSYLSGSDKIMCVVRYYLHVRFTIIVLLLVICQKESRKLNKA